MYKTQGWEFPQWVASTTVPSTGQANDTGTSTVGSAVRRDAHAHTLDLWGRYQTKRFRLEAEVAGVLGEIGDSSTVAGQTAGPVLLRQLGGALQAGWKFLGDRLTIGGEVGFASGDRNPGFGNRPGRYCSRNTAGTGTTCTATPTAAIDGLQFAPGDRVTDVRNFRFNPAYRVDLILWREILQGVTDAFYLKPSARYDIFGGLSANASIIYSQAMYASSTPSTNHTPLGIEFDLGLSYRSEDGFIAFLNYGLLQPLSGFDYEPGRSSELSSPGTTRAHAVRSGFAIKF
jgi:uncharacterized protein (TIGR04551 family)